MPTLQDCPAPGCHHRIPSSLFACRPHWFALPDEIRDEIWETWRRRRSRRRGRAHTSAVAAHRAAVARAMRWYEENLEAVGA